MVQKGQRGRKCPSLCRLGLNNVKGLNNSDQPDLFWSSASQRPQTIKTCLLNSKTVTKCMPTLGQQQKCRRSILAFDKD